MRTVYIDVHLSDNPHMSLDTCMRTLRSLAAASADMISLMVFA